MSASNQQIDLVKGIFSEKDADHILHHPLKSKIDFHCRRSFRLQERYGVRDEFSERRIEELRAAEEDINQLIATLRASGKNVRVRSVIELELTDTEPTLQQGVAQTADCA